MVVSFEGNIAAAYDDVRNDKSPTNWLKLEYKDDKSDAIHLVGTGNGGLDEFKASLKPDKAAFGYLRMVVGNDELSRRSKFILVSYCGPDVKVMRKAKLAVHLGDVKTQLKAFALEVSASGLDELKESDINLLLKKAMGANYDRQTSAY